MRDIIKKGLEGKQSKDVTSKFDGIMKTCKEKFDDYQSIAQIQVGLLNDTNLPFDEKIVNGLIRASEDLLAGDQGKEFTKQHLDKVLTHLGLTLKDFQAQLSGGSI